MISSNFSLTLPAYKALLLSLLRCNTQFISDIEFIRCGCRPGQVFLRHDIDYTLNQVFELATLESSLGIKSAFYFMVSEAPCYSIFSSEFDQLVSSLRDMGHFIGIHLDTSENFSQDSASASIAYFINRYNFSPSSFTIHNPTLVSMDEIPTEISSVLNAAHPSLFTSTPYSSDSNGIPKGFMTTLSNESVHSKATGCLLIHPLWWTTNRPHSPRDKVILSFASKFRTDLRSYDSLLHSNNRPNFKLTIISSLTNIYFTLLAWLK